MGSRTDVVAAARRLFAERGYAQVTIRQVAAEAGVSPSLVMKVAGSKERLYELATPTPMEILPDGIPSNRLGFELVQRIVTRRANGQSDPFVIALLDALQAPDPVRGREGFHSRFIGGIARRLPAHPDRTLRVERAVTVLVGLATSIRLLRLLDVGTRDEDVVAEFAGVVQRMLDGAE